ncbi:helix-turn-helix protein [Rhizobium subbaraonis]|uniref:Helix-turn-helix protein n=1 Tax=Rhizobium subbaraonis TaxID=908946 RepID=A0A285UZ10_9HYPH|nr:helix-turn-helix transcriptional regulator [Rhizobium subbaraonis]SOC46588.1 helix-turn-helix protein [Rhizobium subbaraonis]
MATDRELWKAAGKRLAAARKHAGYDRLAFANEVGLAEPTIAKYEQGAREIPISLLHWLSESHGVNGNWVITGHGNMLGDPSKGPAPSTGVDIVLLQQLHDAVQAVFVECKQTPPPRAVTAEAGELYNQLLGMVADIRDKAVVTALIPVLRQRFKERIANAAPGTGKREAS